MVYLNIYLEEGQWQRLTALYAVNDLWQLHYKEWRTDQWTLKVHLIIDVLDKKFSNLGELANVRKGYQTL